MKETWTDIPGLEGKYKISNMGRYKRLSRYIQGRRLPEEILPLNQSQVREVRTAQRHVIAFLCNCEIDVL